MGENNVLYQECLYRQHCTEREELKNIASNPKTSSECLNKIIRNEMQNATRENNDIIEAARKNPNFEIELETIQIYATRGTLLYRLIAIKMKEDDNKFLNEMLQDEISSTSAIVQKKLIVDMIMENPKFEMDYKTRKIIANLTSKEYRERIAVSKKSSARLLNKMLRQETIDERKQSSIIAYKILENPNFKMEKKTFKYCANSNWSIARGLVAKNRENSSKFLNEMLRKEVLDESMQSSKVLMQIATNPNFKIEEETLNICINSNFTEARRLIAKDNATSSKLLNKMLRQEIKDINKKSSDVVDDLLSNANLKPEEETLEICAFSDFYKAREFAAKNKLSASALLNRLLIVEQGNSSHRNEDILEAVKSNPNFKLEEETMEHLAYSEWSKARYMIAESKESSLELLNEMLIKEAERSLYTFEGDVFKKIQSNPNFKLKQETLTACVKSKITGVRIIMAKSEEISSKLLNEMLRNEITNVGKQDSRVIEGIVKNPKFEAEEETLNYVYPHVYPHEVKNILINGSKASLEILVNILANSYSSCGRDRILLQKVNQKLEEEKLRTSKK